MSNHKNVVDKEEHLVQTRVNKKAKVLIEGMARSLAVSESAAIRQLLYKGLGLMLPHPRDYPLKKDD